MRGLFDPLAQEPTLAVVLGDFGRDATLRFCTTLADLERAHLTRQLDDAPFYDEYRQLTLALVADLPLVKADRLRRFQREGTPLDDRVLVGFSGGVSIEQVTAGLCVLALEAMVGPLARGMRQVLVLLPCNTLAPVSWALERCFTDLEELRTMAARALPAPALEALLERTTPLAEVRPRFPTVPEAVVRHAAGDGVEKLLPLGTGEIVAIYRQAAARCRAAVTIIAPDLEQQRQTLDAIRACISGERAARRAARSMLERLAGRAREEHGSTLQVVEACTDLDLGVGLSSTAIYAGAVLTATYRGVDG